MLFTGLARSVLGETVPEVLRDLRVSGKFYFSLQPMCAEVGRVLVDEARDRLQTKPKHYQHDF